MTALLSGTVVADVLRLRSARDRLYAARGGPRAVDRRYVHDLNNSIALLTLLDESLSADELAEELRPDLDLALSKAETLLNSKE